MHDTAWTRGEHAGPRSPQPPATDLAEALRPWLRHLRAVDAATETFEIGTSTESAARELQTLMTMPIAVQTPWGRVDAKLDAPATLRSLATEWARAGLRIQVARARSGLPRYLVARTRRAWATPGGCILEAMHRSPGYPSVDERFAVLSSSGGSESHFARLEQFRPALCESGCGSPDILDDLLGRIWEWVLGYAWHDDQRVVVVTATRFDTPRFLQATELVYLVLTADLSALRGAAEHELIAFFRHTYPQPAIASFLTHIGEASGAELDALPQDALAIYTRLTRAFSAFLQTEVRCQGRALPLYKLVFSSLLEPNGLAPDPSAELDRSRRTLEAAAATAIGQCWGEPTR